MKTRGRLLTTALGAGVACATVLGTPGTATANGSHTPTVKVLNSKVTAPFQLDFVKGHVLIADGGTSTVSRLTGKGLHKLFTTAEGLGAFAVNGRGDVAYGLQQGDPEAGTTTLGTLTIKFKKGGTKVVDLLAYDKKKNPDAINTYGIDNPTTCQQNAFGPYANYTGGVDSHPYAVAPLGNDSWVVADAGGNDLLLVDRKGHVRTIAVFDPVPVVITAELAAANDLPDCVVGATYAFEPVPTDVEVTQHGFVVSLLSGGPEGPGVGSGSVWSVGWHDKYKIAGGFDGATNVAIDPRGNIYVAELFGGQVDRISHGKVTKYVTLPNALSLVWGKGTLFAGTLAPGLTEGAPTGPGTIVAIR